MTKLFGRKGDFYRIAGDKARAIDGPTSGTIPPYKALTVVVHRLAASTTRKEAK